MSHTTHNACMRTLHVEDPSVSNYFDRFQISRQFLLPFSFLPLQPGAGRNSGGRRNMRPNRDSYLSAVGGSDAGSVNMNASNVSLASNGSGRRSREEKLPVKLLPELNLYRVKLNLPKKVLRVKHT